MKSYFSHENVEVDGDSNDNSDLLKTFIIGNKLYMSSTFFDHKMEDLSYFKVINISRVKTFPFTL